jgi:hypothetical protein
VRVRAICSNGFHPEEQKHPHAFEVSLASPCCECSPPGMFTWLPKQHCLLSKYQVQSRHRVTPEPWSTLHHVSWNLLVARGQRKDIEFSRPKKRARLVRVPYSFSNRSIKGTNATRFSPTWIAFRWISGKVDNRYATNKDVRRAMAGIARTTCNWEVMPYLPRKRFCPVSTSPIGANPTKKEYSGPKAQV